MEVQPIEVQSRMVRFHEVCRAQGVRLTPQRLEIFRAVAQSSEHPDAETVLRCVQERFPNVSLDTVYRTLWLLNDLGLVRTLGPRRDSVRFDGESRPHHHYQCKRCQRVWDVIDAKKDPIELPSGVRALGTVDDISLEILGICSDCRKADGPASSLSRTSRAIETENQH